MNTVNLLGVNFYSVDLKGAAELVLDYSIRKKKGLVVTPNVDHLVCFEKDECMKIIFSNSMLSFCDSMPIYLYGKTFKNSLLPGRVAGSDLFFSVCELAAQKSQSIYLIGGQPGSCEIAIKRLSAKYNNIIIKGFNCPVFGFENNESISLKLVEDINQARPDLIILGLGSPKQEKWASKWLHCLNCGPILCLGAAIDLAAGKVTRAPVFFQKLSLEWFWRLIMEPRRLWRRYLLNDSYFFVLIVKDLVRRFKVFR
jgi:N-acetylglucosaminyldiphosphoundecaprenol N-acetyl-beta-D-mannosaminyltransferase